MKNVKLLPVLAALVIGLISAMPAVAGDTCATATPIPNGDSTLHGDLMALTDDYSYLTWGAGYGDAVFAFALWPGDVFFCDLYFPGHMVVYLVTDCSDCDGSVIASNDDCPAQIDYTNSGSEVMNLYLIVDGNSEAMFDGYFTLMSTNGGTVGNGESDWAAVKALYR